MTDDTQPKPTGGPAFPGGSTGRFCNNYPMTYQGMTLRDYFAGQVISNIAEMESTFSAQHLASRAYRIADAMIEARNATNP